MSDHNCFANLIAAETSRLERPAFRNSARRQLLSQNAALIADAVNGKVSVRGGGASQRCCGGQWERGQVAAMMRVEIKPELLRWARERSGLDPAALARRFPQLDTWERLESSPTLKQLESFAKATHPPSAISSCQRHLRARSYPGLPHRRQRTHRTPRPGPSRHRLYLPATSGVVPRFRAIRGRGADSVRGLRAFD